MDQSGSRYSYPEVIDLGKLKSKYRIFLESVITITFWWVFFYLLFPLITLVFWLLGVHLLFVELIGNEGYMALIRLLKNSGLLTFFIMFIILGWAYYNYFWFRIRGERRNKQVKICFDEDFAKLYNIDIETLREAKTRRSLVIQSRENGLSISI